MNLFEKLKDSTQEDIRRATKKASSKSTLTKGLSLGSHWSWYVGLLAYVAACGMDWKVYFPLTFKSSKKLYNDVFSGLLWESYQATATATKQADHNMGLAKISWGKLIRLGEKTMKTEMGGNMVEAIAPCVPVIIADFQKRDKNNPIGKEPEKWGIATDKKREAAVRKIFAACDSFIDVVGTAKDTATTTTKDTTKDTATAKDTDAAKDKDTDTAKDTDTDTDTAKDVTLDANWKANHEE